MTHIIPIVSDRDFARLYPVVGAGLHWPATNREREQWEETVARRSRTGVQRVPVTAAEFEQYCVDAGLPMNSATFGAYVISRDWPPGGKAAGTRRRLRVVLGK